MHRSSMFDNVRPLGLVAAAMLALCLCGLSAAASPEGARPAATRGAHAVDKSASATTTTQVDDSVDGPATTTTELDRERRLALLIDTRAEATPFNEPAPSRTAAPPTAAKRLAFLRDVQLPEPDRWAAVAATLALAIFFFLRRVM